MEEELIHLAAKLYRVSHLATSCISEIPPTTSQFLLLALFLSSSTTSQNRKLTRSITTTIDHIASTITITTDDKITPSPSPPLPRFSTALFLFPPCRDFLTEFCCSLLLPQFPTLLFCPLPLPQFSTLPFCPLPLPRTWRTPTSSSPVSPSSLPSQHKSPRGGCVSSPSRGSCTSS